MKLSLIIYAFILGILNRCVLCKIPIFAIYNDLTNFTLIIILEFLTFAILEIFLYRKTTLKESIIVSIVRFCSYFLGTLVDYFIIYKVFNNIFDNNGYTILHMLSTKIVFFLMSTSSLIGLIISANKEDKWKPYKEYIKNEEKKTSN